MIANPTTVLLVEDDHPDAGLIRAALAAPFRVEWVMCLADAFDRLAREHFDVVLLDLTLPDGEGIEAFDRVHRAAPIRDRDGRVTGAVIVFADAAMLYAKAGGGNSYRFFTAEIPGRMISMRTTRPSAAR